MGRFGRSRRKCAGARCVGLIGVLLAAGACSPDEDSRYAPLPAASTVLPDSAPFGKQQPGERFYVHGTLNVRAGPGTEHPIVRRLSRGDTVLLGPRDANGWAELRTEDGEREGYVHRASGQLRDTPPSAPSPGPAEPGRVYHLGPRGGCYTYTPSGRKRYVDRSYCD